MKWNGVGRILLYAYFVALLCHKINIYEKQKRKIPNTELLENYYFLENCFVPMIPVQMLGVSSIHEYHCFMYDAVNAMNSYLVYVTMCMGVH